MRESIEYGSYASNASVPSPWPFAGYYTLVDDPANR